jgi:hypothetical protein
MVAGDAETVRLISEHGVFMVVRAGSASHQHAIGTGHWREVEETDVAPDTIDATTAPVRTPDRATIPLPEPEPEEMPATEEEDDDGEE